MAFLLDGKSAASEIKKMLAKQVQGVIELGRKAPRLAVIQVGDDEASSVYVRQKEKACKEVGILSTVVCLKDNGVSTLKDVVDTINKLNKDDDVNGILLQLPLPEEIRYATHYLINLISSYKDVDCLTDRNLSSRIYTRKTCNGYSFAPCTAMGIITLARMNKIDFAGKHCVIVGRSPTVSKPLASMLVACDATVTMCHTKTLNLPNYTQTADVLISATGHRDLIVPAMVKEGVIVFDVGINKDNDGKLHGDVHPDVQARASYITPVPGGVGPMTVAMLLHNTITMEARTASIKQAVARVGGTFTLEAMENETDSSAAT